MTRDEALRLAGGYAPNTLTAQEKTALFQAALEHQEVFDLLQQDQSLREILENPAFRAELLSAAQQRSAWYRTWWTWAGLGVAAAATAVIVVMLREPKPAAVTKPVAQVMVPLPPPAAVARSAAPSAALDSLRESRKVAEQFTATVVREGGGVRIEVKPEMDGTIRLYRVNEQGTRSPVFPPNPGLPVKAGETYRIPFEVMRPVRELKLVVAFVPTGSEKAEEHEIRIAP